MGFQTLSPGEKNEPSAGQLISESRLFPLRQTDVATDAPWTARMPFGEAHRLRCTGNRGIMPAREEGGTDHAREHTRAHVDGRTHSHA